MKFDAPPERIWLQLHGDCEPEYPVECDESVTWCWESIFPQDIEYVRREVAKQMVKATREECAEICERIDLASGVYSDIALDCAKAIRETIK